MITSCDKAKRKARWLRYAIVAWMAAVVLFDVVLVGHGAIHADPNSMLLLSITSQLDGHPRLASIECLLLSAIYLYGLYRLVLLMTLFERGEFFTIAATRHLRAFALSLFVGTVTGCLLPPIELLLARVAGNTQIHSASFQLDNSDLWMILISALFFVIAWIMGEARQLAEDNQLII